MRKKIGKLEFYRFVFCIAVLFFHAEKYLMGEPKLTESHLGFALFSHGSIGVEFFFLLSGFLLAKSAFKGVQEKGILCSKELTLDSISFIKNKYLRIFPEHLVAYIITFLVYVISTQMSSHEIVKYFIDNIPSFLLIQMSGLRLSSVNHLEWYVSCMLIAMAIIYPICRKYYFQFTRYGAPLISLLILGILYHETKSLTNVDDWLTVAYKSTFRAFVEISLGTTAFEVSRMIAEKKSVSRTLRIFATGVELFCFAAVMMYMLSTLPKKYEYYALGCIFVLLILASSGLGYGEKLFDNKAFDFLGKLSFPIYLCQLSAIYFVQGYLSEKGTPFQVSAMVVITLAAAGIVYVLGKVLNKYVFMKKKTV